MQVVVGDPITSTLIDPAGDYDRLGARIEVPITEAIVSPWQDAVLTGAIWEVTLDPLLEAGDYLLYWMTPDSPASFREPIPCIAVTQATLDMESTVPDFPPLDPADVTPTVQEVADLERTRTMQDGGSEITTFDSTTRPTDTEVLRLITQAVGPVINSLYPSFPTSHYDAVKHCVCLYTAILIEGSYFREQVSSEGAMSVWRAAYQAAITGVQASIEYDLKQWRLMQRIEPPFTERREPWQYPFVGGIA
jgi:hypothetical protein